MDSTHASVNPAAFLREHNDLLRSTGTCYAATIQKRWGTVGRLFQPLFRAMICFSADPHNPPALPTIFMSTYGGCAVTATCGTFMFFFFHRLVTATAAWVGR
jgi:hypothetical protein